MCQCFILCWLYVPAHLVDRYITMDAAKGQKMFYVFGEAETDPKSAPIIFWMNG